MSRCALARAPIHPWTAATYARSQQFSRARPGIVANAQQNVSLRLAGEPPTDEPASFSGDGDDRGVNFSYHSDGHYKATIEDVFKGIDTTKLARDRAPWNMGWQTNERNIAWHDDLKLKLLKKVAAQQASMSESELESRLTDLVRLLPDIEHRIGSMKVEQILKLMDEKEDVAKRLLALKLIFPSADCSKMLAAELSLLSEALEGLQMRAEELRTFLPSINTDKLVEDNPCVLSVDSFKAAVTDARRLMPGLDIGHMMMKDPSFILSLQKGSDLIPYDPIPGHDH